MSEVPKNIIPRRIITPYTDHTRELGLGLKPWKPWQVVAYIILCFISLLLLAQGCAEEREKESKMHNECKCNQ